MDWGWRKQNESQDALEARESDQWNNRAHCSRNDAHDDQKHAMIGGAASHTFMTNERRHKESASYKRDREREREAESREAAHTVIRVILSIGWFICFIRCPSCDAHFYTFTFSVYFRSSHSLCDWCYLCPLDLASEEKKREKEKAKVRSKKWEKMNRLVLPATFYTIKTFEKRWKFLGQWDEKSYSLPCWVAATHTGEWERSKRKLFTFFLIINSAALDAIAIEESAGKEREREVTMLPFSLTGFGQEFAITR